MVPIFATNSINELDDDDIVGIKDLEIKKVLKRYSYEEHMIAKVNQDQKILKFFMDINEYAEKVDRDDLVLANIEFEKVCQKSMILDELVEDKLMTLEELGVNVTRKYETPYTYVASPTTEDSFKNVNDKYELVETTYPIDFNGLKLDLETLAEDGKKYKDAHKAEKNALGEENLSKKEEDLINNITNLEIKLRVPQVNKKEKEKELAGMKTELKLLQKSIKRKEDVDREYELYKAFSKEQKEAIKSYLETVEDALEEGLVLEEKENDIREIKDTENQIQNSRGKYLRAYSTLIVENKYTKEFAEKVTKLFETELNKMPVDENGYKIGEEELHTKEGEVVSPLSLRWFVAKIAIDKKQDELIQVIEENKMLRKTEGLITEKESLKKDLEKKKKASKKDQE